MNNDKSVFFDLRFDCRWGDKCLLVPVMSFVRNLGYGVAIITDNWNNPPRLDYDPLNPGTIHDGGIYHPHKEPIDFFANLIVPSLDAGYYDIPTNTRAGEWDRLSRAACSSISYTIDTPKFARETVFTSQLKYVLADGKKDEAYNKMLAEMQRKKNIIVYATWDDDRIYERHNNPASRGLNLPEDLWNKTYSSIMAIDDYCCKNPDYRIVLISLKAVMWDTVLKSSYLDLRKFQQHGLCFSQAFELCANNSIATIGQRSTMLTWFSHGTGPRHVVYIQKEKHQINLPGIYAFNPDSLDIEKLLRTDA